MPIFYRFIIGVLCLAASPALTQAQPTWQPLQKRLVDDGYSQERLENIFNDSRMEFLAWVVPKKSTHSESKLDYEQFVAEESKQRAAAFFDTHRELLDQIESEYGVEPAILVALLEVETRLGRYTGSTRTINALASLARGGIQENATAAAKRQGKWAYRELKALLDWQPQAHSELLDLQGSPFGAFGIPQFIPSSAAAYGQDFDESGQVDLFTLPDAVASAAHYLQEHGWQPDLSRNQKLQILKKYNHSTPYAEAVMSLAERLLFLQKEHNAGQ